VFVGDIVDANVCALERGSGGIFNIGCGRGLTVNDLAAQLKKITGYGGELRYAPARSGEVYRIALDASRARAGLGWEPKTALEDGLRATVDWVRQTMGEPR
jgi:UDP-glucose 4-epimerase